MPETGDEGLPMHLTPTQLADHLACKHLTQLERQQREGRLKIDFSPDPRPTSKPWGPMDIQFAT